MKILLHVGLHRAGSTSFQAWLESQRGALAARRKFLFSDLSSGKQGSLLGALVGDTLAAAEPAGVAGLVEEELERLSADYDGGIISDENLLGKLPGHGVVTFGAAERLALVLTILSQRHEIVPVLILREPVAWLASLYAIARHRGDPRAFAAFVSEVLPEGLGFAPVVQRLAEAVRPAVPIVTTLEAIAADRGKSFLRRIRAELELTSVGPDAMPVENRAPPSLAVAIRHQAARRGAFLVFDAHPDLLPLIQNLAKNPKAGDPAALVRLAELIRLCTVPLQRDLAFRQQLKRAAALVAQKAPPFLEPRQGRNILNEALASLDVAVPSAGERARLHARFAPDRRALADRYGITWNL